MALACPGFNNWLWTALLGGEQSNKQGKLNFKILLVRVLCWIVGLSKPRWRPRRSHAVSLSPQRHATFDPAGSYAVDGLKPDTLYMFSLAAKSEMGLGVFTQPARARTAQSSEYYPGFVYLVRTMTFFCWNQPNTNEPRGVRMTSYWLTGESLDCLMSCFIPGTHGQQAEWNERG